jgi:hypothetical protein
MANDVISADMVSGSEFPFLVVKYNVSGVPHTVVNEEHGIAGALPEKEFAEEILRAIGS